jgi:hypothetical protein
MKRAAGSQALLSREVRIDWLPVVGRSSVLNTEVAHHVHLMTRGSLSWQALLATIVGVLKKLLIIALLIGCGVVAARRLQSK